MARNLMMHWKCDGCNVVRVVPENYQPAGWVVIGALVAPDLRLVGDTVEFTYVVCSYCWERGSWWKGWSDV